MLFHVILCFLCLSHNSINVADPTLDISLIPDSLLVNAHAVIRFERTKCDIVRLNKKHVTKEKAITVLDEAGISAGIISIHYTDKVDKVKDLKIEIFDSKGKRIKEVNKKEIKDLSVFDGFSIAGDARRKYYSYTSNAFPYTVKYEYITESENTLWIPSWFPIPNQGVSVQSNTYEIASSVPGYSLLHKSRNLEAFSLKEDNEIHRYTATDVKAIKWEPKAPHYSEYFPIVRFMPNKFVYFEIEGSFTDWKMYGQWMYDNMLKERGTLPEEVIQELSTIIPEGSSKEDIARIVYDYVTESTRYVSVQLGAGGYRPFEPKDVYNLKYGDCKALSFYTANILDYYNIESIYTEIMSERSYALGYDEDIPGPGQGNHVILCLPNGGDTLWLECTSNSTFFGYAHSGIDQRQGLLITPEGGRLITTTKFAPKDNLAIKNAHLTFEEDKTLQIKFNNIYYNQRHEAWASLLKDGEKEREDKLRKYFFDYLPAYTLLAYNISSNEREWYIQEEATIKVKNLLEKAGNYLILPYMVEDLYKPRKLDTDRVQDIYIKNGKRDEIVINISIPEGYTISEKTKELDFENTFGRLNVNKEKKNDSLYTVTVNVDYNEGTFDSKLVTEYNLFAEKLSKVVNDKIIFKPN